MCCELSLRLFEISHYGHDGGGVADDYDDDDDGDGDDDDDDDNVSLFFLFCTLLTREGIFFS